MSNFSFTWNTHCVCPVLKQIQWNRGFQGYCLSMIDEVCISRSWMICNSTSSARYVQGEKQTLKAAQRNKARSTDTHAVTWTPAWEMVQRGRHFSSVFGRRKMGSSLISIVRRLFKITWTPCISDLGRIWPILNHKILDITQLCLRFCSIVPTKSNPNSSAILSR